MNPSTDLDWSLISASNNEAVLKTCLAASPCIGSAHEFHVVRGFPSAAEAYNAGIRKTTAEILVLAHQDIYLPPDWDRRLTQSLAALSSIDPNWGVLGSWGIGSEGKPCGHCYCTGLQKVLGADFLAPSPAKSLDEMLLVLRRSSGLRFDERLPGYHLYGTDLCLTAAQRGMKSYVIPAFCIHNTAGLKFLPWAFWRAYLFMRRKWWNQLPVKTPCIRLSRLAAPVIEAPLRSAYSHWLKRRPLGNRVADPSSLYRELVRSGLVRQPEELSASRG